MKTAQQDEVIAKTANSFALGIGWPISIINISIWLAYIIIGSVLWTSAEPLICLRTTTMMNMRGWLNYFFCFIELLLIIERGIWELQ